MTNLEKLTRAIDEGMNRVRLYPADNGGVCLELTHRATYDNAVTLYLPANTDMIFWAEAGHDDKGDSEVNHFHQETV